MDKGAVLLDMGEYQLTSGTKHVLEDASEEATQSTVDISTQKTGNQAAVASKLPHQISIAPPVILESNTKVKKTSSEWRRTSLTRRSPLVVQDRESAQPGPCKTLRLYQVRRTRGYYSREGGLRL